MEAASIPAGPPASQRIRALIGTYGLTLLLLALPIVYAIQDLADDGNLVRLGENLTAGISNGAIWALVAIGYTLVYGIVELINFAHGEVFMIGSFISASFFMTIGLHEDTSAGILFFGLLLTLFVAMISVSRSPKNNTTAVEPSCRPIVVKNPAEMNEPIMKISPWAKLISSTMPYTSV